MFGKIIYSDFAKQSTNSLNCTILNKMQEKFRNIMVNQKTDRRIQKTKNLLWQSLVNLTLEKGYDDVTVQDIIDRANVGRSTFYSHYESKENLLLSGQVHILDALFQDNVNVELPNFKGLLEHGQQNIQITKAILNNKDSYLIVEHINNFVSQKLLQYVNNQAFKISEKDKMKFELLVFSASSAIVGLILNWIKNDAIISFSEIEEIIDKIIRSLLIID